MESALSLINHPHAKLVFKSKESISTFQVQEGSRQNDNEHCQCEHDQISPSEDRRHHNIRLRKLILPALLVLLTPGGLLVWSCINWHGRSTWEGDSLVRRASDGTICHYSSILFLIPTGLNLRGFSKGFQQFILRNNWCDWRHYWTGLRILWVQKILQS